jgi:hypothetical protein
MQTLSGALGAVAVAVLATLIGRYALKIVPPGGVLGGFLISYVSAALGTRLVPCAWDPFAPDLCLVPAVVGVLIAWYFMRDLPGPAICEALVKVSLQNGQPVAKPYAACLRRGRPLTWDIQAGPRDDVTIEFKQKGRQKGPFVHDFNNKHNPQRGVYHTVGPDEVFSNAAELTGRFEYGIVWKTGGREFRVDPEVCVI